MTENPETSSTSTGERTLHSWKEIAVYLKRDVSTVKRWEKREGLPVHRHMHALRGSVAADTAELDAWRASRRAAPDTVPFAPPSGMRVRLLAVATLPLIALASAGDGRLALAAHETAQASGQVVQRRVLSQRDMNLNNFWVLKPSPDGHRVAYSSIGMTEAALFVRDLDSGNTEKLTSGESAVSPVWSPDARRIAYSSRAMSTGASAAPLGDPILKILDVSTRTSTGLIEMPGTEILPLDWSPDGSQLLCALNRKDKTSSLVLVQVSGGGLQTLVQSWTGGVNSSASFASFSPDGRFVAFPATEGANTDIYVVGVDGRERHRITQEPGPERFPIWAPTGDALVYQRDDGAWAVRIVDGRAQGAPELINAQNFDQPIAWTRSGLFFHVAYNLVTAGFAQPVRAESGQSTGAPERIDANLGEQPMLFAWSPDMRSLASAEYDGTIHLYSTTEKSSKSFAVGQRASALWWSSDGKRVLVSPYQGTTVLGLTPADGKVRQMFAQINDGERFRMAADETRLVYFKGPRGQRQLVVTRIGDADGRAIASESDPAGEFSNWVRPVFASDSRILFARSTASEASLWVVDPNGSNLRRVATVPQTGTSLLRDAVWSPNGRFIAYDVGNSITVLDVRTGAVQRLPLPAAVKNPRVVQWSPNGDRIGFIGATQNLELWATEHLLANLKTR